MWWTSSQQSSYPLSSGGDSVLPWFTELCTLLWPATMWWTSSQQSSYPSHQGGEILSLRLRFDGPLCTLCGRPQCRTSSGTTLEKCTAGINLRWTRAASGSSLPMWLWHCWLICYHGGRLWWGREGPHGLGTAMSDCPDRSSGQPRIRVLARVQFPSVHSVSVLLPSLYLSVSGCRPGGEGGRELGSRSLDA
jgi:hypothetical protein